MLWDQRLSVCETRGRTVCETPMFAPALDALCLAADALFERLHAWGWSHADTHKLCVVTDGTGVALIPDLPSEGPGWLIDMAGPGGHMPLLPLADDGVWSLIAAAAETASVH
jgi:hypothetical protein